MTLAVADAFTQLAVHVLAHVPRAGPGDLCDRRHVEASARCFSPRATALLADDAASLAALWSSSALDALDGLPDLHASLPEFRRTAARALAELRPEDVADPPLLRALQRLGPAGELVHASLGLLAAEFSAVWTDTLEPTLRRGLDELRPWLARLCEPVPGLASARIELVWALGARGRAMPTRILIGCPGHLTDAIAPAIVAAHEHAVCTSGQVDHARAEWSALVRLARWLRAAPASLRQAHARWLAGLELGELLTAARDVGLVTPREAAGLDARDRRARTLADLAWPAP
jgi:hypothetical protein